MSQQAASLFMNENGAAAKYVITYTAAPFIINNISLLMLLKR